MYNKNILKKEENQVYDKIIFKKLPDSREIISFFINIQTNFCFKQRNGILKHNPKYLIENNTSWMI